MKCTRGVFIALAVGGMATALYAGAPTPKGGTSSAASDKARTADAVREAVLRALVPDKCRVYLCLLSIKRKAVDTALLQKLEPLGRVELPTPDDFVFDDQGITRAFSKRQARIVDIERVTIKAKSATVDVHLYATGMDATLCTYKLARTSDEWVVDTKATQCTF